MILKLLKQIPAALARLLVYRVHSALHPDAKTSAPAPPAAQAAAVSGPTAVHHSTTTAPTRSTSTTVAANDAAQAARPLVDLDARYLAPSDWFTYQAKEELPELLADPLYALWLTIPNGHKWSHYFAIYRKVFEERRHRPLRILEIGVYLGSGLSLWRQYFDHQDTVIVGIDIQPNCAQFAVPLRGIEVRIGSQADACFLQQVVDQFGPFDIIIDDGSHHTAHQIQSFNHLFDSGLKAGGLYLVEDLHASYWPGWRDSEKTFLDICKELIELMHVHYQRDDLPQTFARHALDQHASISVPAIAKMLGEIRIFDSIALIEKVARPYVPYYVTLEKPPGSA